MRGIHGARHDHSDFPLDQIRSQDRQTIILIFRSAVFDRHVLAFDEARFLQALTERSRIGRVPAGRSAVEESDHRQRCLLRPRHYRQRRRAPEPRDECTPPHRSSSRPLS
jgi:hypothetical protein